MLYDYVIIGGGIAGLYANYLLSTKYKTILLEKNNEFGGRAIEVKFHGSNIKTGAGIGAKHNKHLIRLLNELKIEYSSHESTIEVLSTKKIHNIDNNFDMYEATQMVKNKYYSLLNDNKKESKYDLNNLTMKNFLIKYFGKEFYDNYYYNSEYHDYLDSDISYYIKYYDVNDSNHKPEDILYISWTKLIDALILENCINNYEVKIINKVNNLYCINNEIYTKNIIFAVTLEPLNNLLNMIMYTNNLNEYIYTVPFVRIYTYHKNEVPNNFNYIIVDNELQKMIYLGKHVMMASYSDSENALYWNKNANKTLINNKVIEIFNKLDIHNSPVNDYNMFFWKEGVHYFRPNEDIHSFIHYLSNPYDNIYVVGEILSYKQGWVEGCIESVDRVISPLL